RDAGRGGGLRGGAERVGGEGAVEALPEGLVVRDLMAEHVAPLGAGRVAGHDELQRFAVLGGDPDAELGRAERLGDGRAAGGEFGQDAPAGVGDGADVPDLAVVFGQQRLVGAGGGGGALDRGERGHVLGVLEGGAGQEYREELDGEVAAGR